MSVVRVESVGSQSVDNVDPFNQIFDAVERMDIWDETYARGIAIAVDPSRDIAATFTP